MRYFWLTLKHKWFVLIAGRRTGCPMWRLLLHDWTKFLPCELPHYQRQFFGSKDDPAGFARCWTHHQNSNPHHWEYWIPRTGRPANEPIPMPSWAVREMVADWLAAGRAYEGKWPVAGDWPWLREHWGKIRVHPDTTAELLVVLAKAGFSVENL